MTLNKKKVVGIIVMAVIVVVAVALGLYFGLKKHGNTLPSTTLPVPPSTTIPVPTPTPTLTPTLPSGTIVVYGGIMTVCEFGSTDRLCKKSRTCNIKYNSRELISYKQNTIYPKTQIYLSKKGTTWIKYNASTGIFELYSLGMRITQFEGKIIAIGVDAYIYVYLPFSKLPDNIKSQLDYAFPNDYYQLYDHHSSDLVDLYGVDNIDVINNIICLSDNRVNYTLNTYNPNTNITVRHLI